MSVRLTQVSQLICLPLAFGLSLPWRPAALFHQGCAPFDMLDVSSEPEISNFELHVFCKEEISKLEISVNYILAMTVLAS